MKNILLMIDLSAKKDNVSQYAMKLAQQLKSNIVLSYIIDEIGGDYAQALSELEKLKADLENSFKPEDHKSFITCLVEKGNFTSAVQGLVKDLHIELIVMGAADGKNDTGFLFGSKVRDIVDKVNCPILLIPEQVMFQGIKNILYVTDIRYSASEIVTQLAALAEPLNVQVSILHVCADGLPDLADETINDLFTDVISPGIRQRLRVYKASKKNPAEPVIGQLIANGKQGILAIAHRKQHFFDHLFTDTPTKEAAIYKQLPILLMPAHFFSNP
ncbi:MAG TPA: universal stress protein [Pseudosphingobacterium sp.]|nr:universal stress protein [Pseudosphingobacterium sp.]